MTVYVDDAAIPAAVRNGSRVHDSRWSHLTADSQDELHDFAARLGLKRSYFQPGKPLGGKPSPFWHYDLTAGKRQRAVQLGAVEVPAREMPRICREREARAAAAGPRQDAKPARRSRSAGQQWSRCPGDGLPIHPGDQKAIADFRRQLERSPADSLDYDAGVALRAGDLDTAARLIYKAREADPARGDLWDARQARIRQAMQATTERRLKDAGIRADDPALAAIRQYHVGLGIGHAEPIACRAEPSQQPCADIEAAQ
jgi:hypothetical protein